MLITEVHFNHNPNSATADALNLRYADGTQITAPEWKDGQKASPAAYARQALTRAPTIKAKFSGGPSSGKVTIRAIENGRGAPVNRRRGSVLGEVLKRDVTFDVNGDSDLGEFEVTGDPRSSLVGISEITWTWQILSGGVWTDVSITRHRVYVLPALPNSPWGQDPAEATDQLPWVEALERACTWAAGASTEVEAADRIVAAINTQRRQSYCESGTAYTPHYDSPFDLSLYLSDLDQAPSWYIDCHGAASAVVTFANLLGANLCRLTMQNVNGATYMTTRLILPIGMVQPADWVSKQWGSHEVALVAGTLLDSTGGLVPGAAGPAIAATGVAGDDSLVCDACLRVEYPTGVLPVRMPLGHVATAGSAGTGYRDKLLDTGSDGGTTHPKVPRQMI